MGLPSSHIQTKPNLRVIHQAQAQQGGEHLGVGAAGQLHILVQRA
jgi:hypothetical protein